MRRSGKSNTRRPAAAACRRRCPRTADCPTASAGRDWSISSGCSTRFAERGPAAWNACRTRICCRRSSRLPRQSRRRQSPFRRPSPQCKTTPLDRNGTARSRGCLSASAFIKPQRGEILQPGSERSEGPGSQWRLRSVDSPNGVRQFGIGEEPRQAHTTRANCLSPSGL